MKKLDAKADKLQNKNYHSESWFYRRLSLETATRDVDPRNAEELISYILEFDW